MDPKRLGERVRDLRSARALTAKEVAARAGLSPRFLSSVESGRANPSLGSLSELATALGVSLVELIGPSGPRGDLIRWANAAHDVEVGRVLARLESTLNTPRPIALLGLRGAGKSTVGPALAKALEVDFVEVDREIEAAAGMNLGALFELHGELHVRELEQKVLTEILAGPRVVLEVGGGVVTHELGYRLLRERTLTVWLKASPRAHWDRVIAQGDARPMDGRARAFAELEQLYEARAPLYARAELIVDTAQGVDAVIASVVEVLQ